MSSIGTKIRKLRESQAMSQDALSEQLGISQTTLHNIECGNSQKVDFLLMDKISKIFEKDIEYFLDNHVVNNHIRENKGQICCSCENFTINNHCPEFLLEELKKTIASKDEQIGLLRELLEKK